MFYCRTKETQMTVIVKKNNEYRVDFGTHEMVYDNCGHYLGQWQDDTETGGRIFLKGDNRCIWSRTVPVPVPSLTAEQLNNLEY